MRSEIKELHQRLKTTTIYVTHDQVEAMTMADKIVVMRDGVVEQEGPPLALYDRPKNLFVASFIGSPAMNFIEGKVESGGFRTASGALLPCPQIGGMEAVTYGIRPENLVVAEDGIPLEVTVIEPTGSETQIIGRIGQQSMTGIFRERIDIAPGQTLLVRPDVTKVHLFDAAGQRIE
jgi:multiple sugar transport system ATP-binding protein